MGWHLGFFLIGGVLPCLFSTLCTENRKDLLLYVLMDCSVAYSWPERVLYDRVNFLTGEI